MGIFVLIALVILVFVFVLTRRRLLRKRDREDQALLETVTNSDRGTHSERNLVLTLLKHGISAQAIYHDLYVKKTTGGFSQIDLVVATTAGIIVFEVKDYSGWIFGNGYQQQWTQVLAYGKQKYRFYNPMMQNNKHIADLRKKRKQFASIPFYSVIMFDGNCELKDVSFIPEGTFVIRKERVWKVMEIIQSKDPAPYTNKREVIQVLKECVENGANEEIKMEHIKSVKDLLGKHRVYD